MPYSWNHRYSFPPFSICLHHCGSSSLWGTLLDRTAEGAKNVEVSITIIKIHHVLHIKKGTEESSSLPFSPSTWSVWLGEPVCGVLRALRTCFRGPVNRALGWSCWEKAKHHGLPSAPAAAVTAPPHLPLLEVEGKDHLRTSFTCSGLPTQLLYLIWFVNPVTLNVSANTLLPNQPFPWTT